MDYNSFVEESLKFFRELPEETNQLYVKDYISVPKEFFIIEENSDDKKTIELANSAGKRIGTTFDLILYGNGKCMSNCKYASACPLSEINFEKKMIKSKSSILAAFVNAYGKNAVQITIPENTSVKISAAFASMHGTISHVNIKLGKHANLELNEFYISDAQRKSVLAASHEIEVGDNASLHINALHNEDPNTFALHLCEIQTGENAKIVSNCIYLGSAFTKSKTKINLNGAAAYGELRESIITSKQQKFDIESEIENKGLRTNAKVDSRAVLMDDSSCYVKGFARLTKGAKESTSDVEEKCMKLDKHATIRAMPDMAIEENNIKAKHASSTDLITGDKLFYLLSRGLSEEQARFVIVEGFLNKNLDGIHDSMFRKTAMALAKSKAMDKEFGKELPVLQNEMVE